MSVYDLIEEFEDEFTNKVSKMERYSPEQLGLDSRCWVKFYIPKEKDCLIVQGKTNTLDYYGGFEYIDAEYIKRIGGYTIYSTDCQRVQDCLDYVFDNDQQESLEEDEEYQQYGI